MIPLTQSLKMAFDSVILARNAASKKNPQLDVREFTRIYCFLRDNCPQYVLTAKEIDNLFISYHKKRFCKKAKQPIKQLSLY